MKYKELVRNHVNNKDVFIKLEKYVELIEKHNKVMNLTGFSGDKLWEEGIYESIISLENSFKNPQELLDIGAGAGFPSVPYLIANKEINLSIIEPIGKRINFLKIVSEELGLNIKLINGRAETCEMSNFFDAITCRAVAELGVLIEISYNLGKNNCEFAWIKGPSYAEEVKRATNIINKTNIKICDIKIDDINISKDIHIIKYEKNVSSTLNVRPWAEIKKQYKKK